jgi:hypothetical protein
MERLPGGKGKMVKSHGKRKGGAPKKTVKRDAFIMVRLTATERFHIATKAKNAGMKISDWFRAAAKNAKVMERLKPEDRKLLHMLAGAANNLNQLTRLAHARGILSIARKCNELLIEIDQALKYLNADDRQDT